MFTVVFKRVVNIRHKTENVLSLSQACPKLEARYMLIAEQIISYCSEPRSIQEIMEVVGQNKPKQIQKEYYGILY